ncbi:helix-turn-helix domain-containing protein [Mesorhizobium sp. M0179]|uniref:helix-turn-helix transcriptional regulator n=1 Tax=Mesorhizobium sp. M0179 TaxID=2956905 RepID=UPI0033385131
MTPEEFKALRTTMGLSQSQAAEALGVSRGSVENYERGKRREDERAVEIPKTVELAAIVRLLGLNQKDVRFLVEMHTTRGLPTQAEAERVREIERKISIALMKKPA